MGIDEAKMNSYSFEDFCMEYFYHIQPELDKEARMELDIFPENKLYRRFSGGTCEFLELKETFSKECRLALAKNLEQAGRYQNAAVVYEQLDDYDSARKMREKDKRVEVKQTNVSVDLNALLKQFQNGGIVAVYRCPHCNGKLKISKDTTMKSLRTCEYCNTEIEAVDLAGFLKTAMS